MTSLLRLFDRISEDKLKTLLALGGMAVVGGLLVYNIVERSELHSQRAVGVPLYSNSLTDFIRELDTTPNNATEALELNKAADRFMADVIATTMSAVEFRNGEIRFPSEDKRSDLHVDGDRYDKVVALNFDLPSWGKQRRHTAEYGKPAVEKLAAVKSAISHFETLAEAFKRNDLDAAETEVVALHDSLNAYVVKFHSREADLDQSSGDLRALERKLYDIADHIKQAKAAQASGPKP